MFRCECLQKEIDRRDLGDMYSDDVVKDTPLLNLEDENLSLIGTKQNVKNHVGGAILSWKLREESISRIDSYQLIDIFLGQDLEFENQWEAVDADRMVLRLGFGDPPNRMLPELLNQVLSRRDYKDKPTWVILGIPKAQVARKYNSEFAHKLNRFKEVCLDN